MAKKKKASKKAAKKTTKKTAPASKAPRKPQQRKRRVSLGLPAKDTSTVKADATEHPAPPAETSTKTDAAGGDKFKHVGEGVYEVTITRRFSAEETGAVMNAAGETEADVDEIGRVLIDFAHKHLDDAVAEAEADTASEQARYNSVES